MKFHEVCGVFLLSDPAVRHRLCGSPVSVRKIVKVESRSPIRTLVAPTLRQPRRSPITTYPSNSAIRFTLRPGSTLAEARDPRWYLDASHLEKVKGQSQLNTERTQQ